MNWMRVLNTLCWNQMRILRLRINKPIQIRFPLKIFGLYPKFSLFYLIKKRSGKFHSQSYFISHQSVRFYQASPVAFRTSWLEAVFISDIGIKSWLIQFQNNKVKTVLRHEFVTITTRRLLSFMNINWRRSKKVTQ